MSTIGFEQALEPHLQELRRELELEMQLLIAELRAEVNRELGDLTARVDSVHTQALRALTQRTEARR